MAGEWHFLKAQPRGAADAHAHPDDTVEHHCAPAARRAVHGQRRRQVNVVEEHFHKGQLMREEAVDVLTKHARVRSRDQYLKILGDFQNLMYAHEEECREESGGGWRSPSAPSTPTRRPSTLRSLRRLPPIKLHLSNYTEGTNSHAAQRVSPILDRNKQKDQLKISTREKNGDGGNDYCQAGAMADTSGRRDGPDLDSRGKARAAKHRRKTRFDNVVRRRTSFTSREADC